MMETKDWVTFAMAVLALGVSGYTYFRTYNLTDRQVRFANRTEFHKLLVDLNKECIRDPSLHGFYDKYQPQTDRRDDPELAAKLKSFGQMQLNMFEMVYLFYHVDGVLQADELDYWNTWESFFKHTIERSSVMRGLLEREDLFEYYSPKFVEYVQGQLRTVPLKPGAGK